MALSDLFIAIESSMAELMPLPGLSSVSANSGASGVVELSGVAYGTFEGVLDIVTGGASGVATAELSLDGGVKFGAVFTIPTSPYVIPLDPTQVSTGLMLTFHGPFTAGDSYSFEVSATPEFLTGQEFVPEAGSFPRVVWVPTSDQFTGSEEYAGGQTSIPRSLVTKIGTFEAHCWGIDYDRTELLLEQVINGIHFAAGTSAEFLSTEWSQDGQGASEAGREAVLTFSIKRPVIALNPGWILVPPPFTDSLTGEFDT